MASEKTFNYNLRKTINWYVDICLGELVMENSSFDREETGHQK